MTPELGIIEGFYGTPWAEEDRNAVISRLASQGYRFFIFAPKADLFLRQRWLEPHPRQEFALLERLSAHCRGLGVRFGVGLSPFEIYRQFDSTARDQLKKKLGELDRLGLDDIAILFDDMRGDLPNLAATQADIVHAAAQMTRATRLITCPSYYTDDPGLDRFFGKRPDNYLEDLGRLLDPKVEVFWTGEEVCAREFSVGHLARVAGQLRRKAFLWDNYPVNDGPRMSPYLYVRGFTGRPASIGPHIAAHGVNPALQAHLSLIPALSLAESYRFGDGYQYGAAFERAATEIGGPDFAAALRRDVTLLHDTGLDRLGSAAERLKARYERFDNPAAREILAWLDGRYRFNSELHVA